MSYHLEADDIGQNKVILNTMALKFTIVSQTLRMSKRKPNKCHFIWNNPVKRKLLVQIKKKIVI
jgi:hypothetical protein